MVQSSALEQSREKIAALLNPKNVVLVGATDKPGNWPQRIWRNLGRYGYAGPVYPFNPTRDEVWSTRCYRNFESLPELPDHLIVAVPAKLVCGILRDAARAGARSATVITSGFRDAMNAEGVALEADLKRTIDETGLAVSGPNCLGLFNASTKFFSMPDDRLQALDPGPVALFGQSGGLMLGIKRAMEERGMSVGALVTSGNETGLSAADYVAYFAHAPEIRVIACYLEAVQHAEHFLSACRLARRMGKAVVVMKLGASEAGRAAAAAHTGSLAGAVEAFDAYAWDAGVLRVRNLSEMVDVVELLSHIPLPTGSRLGGMTFSGGMRGLVLDAADSNGLRFEALPDDVRSKLEAILPVGSYVSNPIDGGAAAVSLDEVFMGCVKSVVESPAFDLLLFQEELPAGPGMERRENNLRKVEALARETGRPIAFISLAAQGLTDYSRKVRAELPHIAFLQEADCAMKAVRAITRYGEFARADRQPIARSPSPEGRRLLDEILAQPGPATLDEPSSKRLLSAYGIRSPREEMARNAEEAANIATRIDFPVVAKVVSASLPHKSDIGGVVLNLNSADEVRQAYGQIERALAALPGKPAMDGVLIAEMIGGGLELVLGASLDPEMGPVILFGSGGVTIELFKDVALAAAPLDEESALALIGRTKAGALVDGYRGSKPVDKNALVSALIGLSNLMVDAGGRIVSIDVNPFKAMPDGGVALDGLVVRAAAVDADDHRS